MYSDTELREAIAERLDYDPKQGAFFRKAGFTGTVAGARVGSPDSAGNFQATFLRKRFQVAHLVWLVETGALPKGALRHVNGENGDDRFSNLTLNNDTDAKQEAFLRKAKAKFPEHDFSQARFKRANAKVQISCSVHGVFLRVASEYLKSKKGCPTCCQEYQHDQTRNTPEENRARDRRRAKRSRLNGKDRERQRVKREANREAHRAYHLAYGRAYAEAHKHDSEYRATRACRCMLNRVIRQTKAGSKSGRTEQMHGYTMQEFKDHIEQQFDWWMTWGNHGQWHVDHIVPVGWLIDHGVTDPRIVNALDNLRPLDAQSNMRRDRAFQ